jgi:uncharacterized protein YqcC (DUF446 family)
MSTFSSKHKQTLWLLGRLRLSLEQQSLWQSAPPSPAELASEQPFCCDTLMFEQWLQFVFIPKMEELCQQQLPLPGYMSLLPMAEQVWPEHVRGSELMQTLHAFDRLYQQEP